VTGPSGQVAVRKGAEQSGYIREFFTKTTVAVSSRSGKKILCGSMKRRFVVRTPISINNEQSSSYQ
jgi:hypothetical protein